MIVYAIEVLKKISLILVFVTGRKVRSTPLVIADYEKKNVFHLNQSVIGRFAVNL